MVFSIINAYSNYTCGVMDQEKNGLKGRVILCGYFYTHAQNVEYKSLRECIYIHRTALLFKNETQPEKFFQSLIIWLSALNSINFEICFSYMLTVINPLLCFSSYLLRDFQLTCVCLCVYKYTYLCLWAKYPSEERYVSLRMTTDLSQVQRNF